MIEFTPELIAAKRFAAVALATGVAIMSRVGLSRGNWQTPATPEVRLMRWRGINHVTTGLAIHQLHWWLWQMAIVARTPDLKAALENAAVFVMVPAYALILHGLALLAGGYTEPLWGRHWLGISAGLITAVLAIGLLTALGARP